MSIFDEDNNKHSVSQIEYPSESGRSPMVMLPVLAGVAIIVAILLFFGGRWIYRTIANDSPPQPNISESQSSNSSTKQAPNPAPSTPAPTQQPSPNTNAQNNSNLPNSGPGEVIALFITVTTVATATYYVAYLRHQNSLN
jgi:cytoskeletal protein RodZ